MPASHPADVHPTLFDLQGATANETRLDAGPAGGVKSLEAEMLNIPCRARFKALDEDT